MSSERSRRIALLEQRTSKNLGFHDPDPEARGTGIYSGIGDVLRQARERRGLTLQEVAAHLRISETYLAAIECGRFAQLPGRSYVLGFLRSYGKFLDLNADKVVAQYKAEDDDNFARKQQLKFPTVRPEGRTPGLWLLPVVTIIAAVGYLGWYGWKTELVSFDAIVPDVPARLQADIPANATEPATPPFSSAGDTSPAEDSAADPSDRTANDVAMEQESATADGTSRVAALLDRRDGSDTTGEEMRLAPTAGGDPATADTAITAEASDAAEPETAARATDNDRMAAALPSSGAGGQAAIADESDPPPLPSDPQPADASTDRPTTGTAGAPGGGTPSADAMTTNAVPPGRVFGTESSRVVLRASADTWVQVEDAQRNLLLTRVLKAGDIYRAPNQTGLVLMTGNAGGLVVEVDGEAIPSLGPRGAVRRNVSLDPDRLLDGSQLVN